MNSAPSFAEIVLDPIIPAPVVYLLGAALLALTVWAYWHVGALIERWRNITLMLFRMAGVALVVLLLLQPSRREQLPPPTKERVTLVALDTSASMKQPDMERVTRLEAAKSLLLDSEVIEGNGQPNSRLRVFQFADDAQPVQHSILDLKPDGKTTRLHKSVSTMLNSPSAGESANALVLLSDGHDFELVNPIKTGAAARAKKTPIYALVMGKQGKVRDVAVRISGFQPYCYVKQKARVAATLRLIGCEFDILNVQLLRQGQVVQTRRVNADELQEQSVEFEVTEPETGQFEYEIRVQPLEHEVDPANNSAITYLNVIDQQIRVLVLEGDPYWDTTFLQRSLMRNDKFDVDALLRYGKDRVRSIRKTAERGQLNVPKTLDELAAYDLIVLGRSMDQLFGTDQIALLDQFVKDRSGAVIFARGKAFGDMEAGELEPVLWDDKSLGRTKFDTTAEGRGLSAFRALNEGNSGLEWLPDMIDARSVAETKPLTATLAMVSGWDEGAPSPAIVHRRYGRGQVVSVGVEGLWRWGLNAKAEGPNTPFDRFWDQMALWLLAGRDFIPTRQFSFRPNSANILLGEKVYFRMTMRQPDSKVKSVPLTLFYGDKEIARANMTASSAGDSRLAAEFLPERTGRYRALANFPDGTTQESRFIVFTDNVEETEVAADVLCLRRLCESSGGRVLSAGELPRLLKELNSEKADTTPRTRLQPLWNATWVFYTVGVLFGLDWFLRRRWGLC